MNIEEILDMMDDLIDRAWNLPLTGGRSVVDVDKVRELIDDIRLNLPSEIKQAKNIVADRNDILTVAKREAETLVRKAEERAKVLVSQEEIYREAQAKAAEILGQAKAKATEMLSQAKTKADESLSQAQQHSREMRQAAQEFSDRVLRESEEVMMKSLSDIKTTRQALRNAAKNQQ